MARGRDNPGVLLQYLYGHIAILSSGNGSDDETVYTRSD
jgi:hypothetical protein